MELAPSSLNPHVGAAICLSALVPLTRPGWVPAGRHLLAGLELVVSELNEAGGFAGRPRHLIRDTAADPQRAAAAVDELAHLGATCVFGEYNSVAARAAAAKADALGIPFLCASAVVDALSDEPTHWVAGLARAQSRGWGYMQTSSLRPAIAASQSQLSRASTGRPDHPFGSLLTAFVVAAIDAG